MSGGGGDDPFGTGPGSFDPSAGLIDSGSDVQSRSNWGVTAFAAALSIVFGASVGWIANNISTKGELVERGKSKGAKMLAAVDGIIEARKGVSLAMEDLGHQMTTSPKEAAATIEQLLKDKFDSLERIDALFGWELGAVHSKGIKSTFELFEEANRLKTDLGYLGAFLVSQADALQAGGSGPSSFAVAFQSGSVSLVGATAALCGENVDQLDSLETCEDPKKAVAYDVIESIGGEPKPIPKGTDAGQAMLLSKDDMYAYAVGLEPHKNATILRDALFARIREHLEAMSKAEKSAQSALSKFASDPNVDGPAPEPES